MFLLIEYIWFFFQFFIRFRRFFLLSIKAMISNTYKCLLKLAFKREGNCNVMKLYD